MAAAAFDRRASSGFGSVGNAALRSAEYVIVKGQFVAPGKHRALMAAGLSAGLFGGRALMDEVTGRHPDGSPVERETVPTLLRPLHGRIRYNPYSDDGRDRWLHALDNLAPGVFGVIGVAAASRFHFKDRIAAAKVTEEIARGVKEGDLTFGKIEQAIAMRHAEPFARWASVASLQGSASGANLSPTGYGPMLSALFSLRADRKVGMGSLHPLKWVTGTKANSPHGLRDMMTELWRHLLYNPTATQGELHDLPDLAKGALDTVFKGATPEQHSRWVEELMRYRTKILKRVEDQDVNWTADQIGTFADGSLRRLERFAIREGLVDMTSRDTVLKSLNTGNNGFLGMIAERDPNTKKAVEALRTAKAQDIYDRHFDYAKSIGKVAPDAVKLESAPIAWPQDDPIRVGRRHVVAGAGLAAAAGAVAYGAAHGSVDPSKDATDRRPNRVASFINGAPLKTTEWVSNSLNFPPGLHRLENALGLTAGMYGGMKLGEALTGLTLGGRAVAKGSVIAPLKPVFGALAYNPFGIETSSRWAKVGHHMLPAIGGFYGSKFGSDHYFSRQRARNAKAEFIDDYSLKISFDQSTPWGYLSAGTALANVGLGINFLPIGYGMNLGNRFTLGSGRKVVLPGMKEIVSNNHSVYPLGPTRLRDQAIEYLVKNPDAEPKQIRDMAGAILAGWFGEQPASRIDRLVADMLEVRNAYLGENGVPEDKQDACRKALKARFTHQGLHDELASIGLDVLQSRLADNGLIGDIGNGLGARKQVERDLAEFRAKELKRRSLREESPAAETDPASVASGETAGFADRVGRAKDRRAGEAAAGLA